MQHPRVVAFVKNQGLGFAIPYLHAGGGHEYIPDFLVRLDNGVTLVLETKGGRDEKAEVKEQAARRWVAAVNADGRIRGMATTRSARDMNEIPALLDGTANVRSEPSRRHELRAAAGSGSTRSR